MILRVESRRRGSPLTTDPISETFHEGWGSLPRVAGIYRESAVSVAVTPAWAGLTAVPPMCRQPQTETPGKPPESGGKTSEGAPLPGLLVDPAVKRE